MVYHKRVVVGPMRVPMLSCGLPKLLGAAQVQHWLISGYLWEDDNFDRAGIKINCGHSPIDLL
jgi:hypothetical protein